MQLSGIGIQRSYEWWNSAVRTHEVNSSSDVREIDIRTLELTELPTNVNVVVGSPPCTEFSYSNRGGSGDIENGLLDIEKFLEVVDHLRPTYWVMENVPRVKKILEKELSPEGRLSRFSHLGLQAHIFDMSEYGLPQRRKRCIAGNINFDLLFSYRNKCKPLTLGSVIDSLHASEVIDPIYGIKTSKSVLTDHDIEEALNDEELRYNREWKCHHPVYNDMSFPEKLNTPVRTITATCTRVSRESIIIKNGQGKLRRLSVRERGCLQGFPTSFQFHGNSYAQKIKMTGNAIPPVFTYYIGQAILGVSPSELQPPSTFVENLNTDVEKAPTTKVDSEGRSYRKDRRFWFAIPNLRFKSGWRFDLSNSKNEDEEYDWVVKFWHGNSKNILEVKLNKSLLLKTLDNKALKPAKDQLSSLLRSVSSHKKKYTPEALQMVWTHREEGMHPYQLLDDLGACSEAAIAIVNTISPEDRYKISSEILGVKPDAQCVKKIKRFSSEIIAGILIGSKFNTSPFHL